jgi:hypothetical protein
MSDIVQMTSDVDNYQEGEVYRVRTRNAQEFQANDTAEVLDTVVVPTDAIEGV